MRIVALVPDLMDQSRLACSEDLVFVRTSDAIAATSADMVVIDLSRPGAVEAIGTVSCAVLAFGPHVDAHLLQQAEAAGAAVVLPRSQFFTRWHDLLKAFAP